MSGTRSSHKAEPLGTRGVRIGGPGTDGLPCAERGPGEGRAWCWLHALGSLTPGAQVPGTVRPGAPVAGHKRWSCLVLREL